jgi:hypothetical protein
MAWSHESFDTFFETYESDIRYAPSALRIESQQINVREDCSAFASALGLLMSSDDALVEQSVPLGELPHIVCACGSRKLTPRTDAKCNLLLRCKTCQRWQHAACMGIRGEAAIPAVYHCIKCATERSPLAQQQRHPTVERASGATAAASNNARASRSQSSASVFAAHTGGLGGISLARGWQSRGAAATSAPASSAVSTGAVAAGRSVAAAERRGSAAAPAPAVGGTAKRVKKRAGAALSTRAKPPKVARAKQAPAGRKLRVSELKQVLTHPASVLAEVDLHQLLTLETFATVLRSAERAPLYSMLPIEPRADAENVRKVCDILRFSPHLRAHMRLHQQLLVGGMLQPDAQRRLHARQQRLSADRGDAAKEDMPAFWKGKLGRTKPAEGEVEKWAALDAAVVAHVQRMLVQRNAAAAAAEAATADVVSTTRVRGARRRGGED